MKDLNFGNLLHKEKEVSEITLKTYQRPFKTLDKVTKFFMETMDFALQIHKTTKDGKLRDYCKYYLTTCNAVLHMIRVSKLAITYGYYGNVIVLMRTLINYLNMSIYIHHHPEDAELLLKESRDDFKENKEYKKKFHEYNLRKELELLGYKVPKEYEDITKTTHGSLWGAQVFGFKGLSMPENEYELSYSPKFSIPQSSTLLSFILAIPIDFPAYFLRHIKNYNLKGYEKIKGNFDEADYKVKFALAALEKTYQFLKNTPEEIQQALLKKIQEHENDNS